MISRDRVSHSTIHVQRMAEVARLVGPRVGRRVAASFDGTVAASSPSKARGFVMVIEP